MSHYVRNCSMRLEDSLQQKLFYNVGVQNGGSCSIWSNLNNTGNERYAFAITCELACALRGQQQMKPTKPSFRTSIRDLTTTITKTPRPDLTLEPLISRPWAKALLIELPGSLPCELTLYQQ
ncbi:hypothetical protein RRG08_061730 [Elysia crispata]|uniref:Uncharacterized protein n=1 Tax=Elysia crispata TaxID=231223 RepID=A0AAE1A7Q3_9GAST|nr:hypothetical protein RRG08_061730 [Elysia crispata]